MSIYDDFDFNREDVYRQLCKDLERVPTSEILFLRNAVVSGNFNGRVYIDRNPSCGCFFGTLALARGIDEESVDKIVYWQENGAGGNICDLLSTYLSIPVMGCADNVVEDFVWHIELGDTPENDHFSDELLTLIDEYLATR